MSQLVEMNSGHDLFEKLEHKKLFRNFNLNNFRNV